MLYQILDQIRIQIIASRLSRGELHCDIVSGKLSPERLVCIHETFGGDLFRHVNCRGILL